MEEFTIKDGVLTKYHGKDTIVKIPDSVERIGDETFMGFDKIQQVIIPNSVTTIGKSAFKGCRNIKSIILPEGLKRIESEAFYNSGIKKITIPDSVEYIGYQAFEATFWYNYGVYDDILIVGKVLLKYNMEDEEHEYEVTIEDVKIPDSVTCIADHAFEYCRFKSITIPNSVKSICDCAFEACDNIKSITIPDSVTEMTGASFSFCEGLSNINVDKNNTALCDVDGVLFSKEKDVLIYYPDAKKGTAYTIPDSVTKIGDYAFENCKNLKNVTMPDSVTSIGVEAFFDCENLESVVMSNSVTSIGKKAFHCCDKLKSLTIPDSVTFIGDEAFWSTPWLENNTDEIVMGGKVIIKYKKKDEISITIPDHITGIYSGAFLCNNVEDITLPESVTSIGYEAFYFCNALKSLTIHDSITKVGEYPLPLDESFETINIISSGTKYVIDVSTYDDEEEETQFDELILELCDFIKNKNYDAKLEPQTKYSIMLDTMIFADEKAAKPYIKKNFVKIMKWLIDEKDMDRLNTIVEKANFITEQNIDTFIDYAEEKKQRNMFNFFTKYKTENFGTAK